MQIQKGFTLVELMIVVIILSILMVIALPSYNAYMRRTHETRAEDQIQSLAMQLERHKSRQFNYLGFTPGTTAITLPVGTTGSTIKYNVTVRDGSVGNPLLTATTATGFSWVIRADATDNKLPSYLMTSTGLKCKNKTVANINNATGCGVGGEAW